MKPSNYRFLLWQLLAALDTGEFDRLSAENVRHHARGGTISKFLQDTFGAVADFSIFTAENWKDRYGVCELRERGRRSPQVRSEE